jgi:hypothetical protein
MTPVPCAMQVVDKKSAADKAASRDLDWLDISSLDNLVNFSKYINVQHILIER